MDQCRPFLQLIVSTCESSDSPVPGTDFESCTSPQASHISPHHEMSLGGEMLAAFPWEWLFASCCRNTQLQPQFLSAGQATTTLRLQLKATLSSCLLGLYRYLHHPACCFQGILGQCRLAQCSWYPVWIEGTRTHKVRERKRVSVGVLLISVLSWPLSTQHVNVQMDCGLNLKRGSCIPHLNSLSLLVSFPFESFQCWHCAFRRQLKLGLYELLHWSSEKPCNRPWPQLPSWWQGCKLGRQI